MTPNKFIRSFGSFQTGEDGYCRLASVSTKKENSTNLIGFWFEIIQNHRGIAVLRVQLNHNTMKLYGQTFLINEESELVVIMDDLRLKAQKICSFLLYSDDEQRCVPL